MEVRQHIKHHKPLMETRNLDFKGGDPGAVQYGNFINYYQFHNPRKRLELLPSHIWSKDRELLSLDIGSNAGDLTIQLQDFLKEKECISNILGIDIDPLLVERAQEASQSLKNIEFLCADFMTETVKLEEYLQKFEKRRFDVVFCFSVTMWIHLNHGDEGLKQFLRKICDLGDLIIIEPQPWKCYKTAVKRMKKSKGAFPFFAELKIRQNVEEEIDNYLLENCSCTKLYTSESSDWGRKLLIYKCQHT